MNEKKKKKKRKTTPKNQPKQRAIIRMNRAGRGENSNLNNRLVVRSQSVVPDPKYGGAGATEGIMSFKRSHCRSIVSHGYLGIACQGSLLPKLYQAGWQLGGTARDEQLEG
jgi:hypothetical protein